MVTAGVFAAANGEPNLYAVIVVAAIGAFVGDHVSYALGRGAGGRLLDRVRPGTKRHAAVLWAWRSLAERGGLVLVVARYVPGGRTAVTLTMGSVRYPLRTFSPYAGLAAVSWGLYCTLVGYIGGKAFEDNPLKGVILGIGLALAVTLVVELLRHRMRKAQPQVDPEPELVDGERVHLGIVAIHESSHDPTDKASRMRELPGDEPRRHCAA